MGELTPKRFPWEPAPVSETVAALQRDLAFCVSHTAILVHSSRPDMCFLVNTPRGQRVPAGECVLSDGTTLEYRDVGMPQVGAPVMTIEQLTAHVWETAQQLGLDLAL